MKQFIQMLIQFNYQLRIKKAMNSWLLFINKLILYIINENYHNTIINLKYKL